MAEVRSIKAFTMPDNPSVCAVMLTANRPELAKRAVECFRAQTYAEKALLIWDTSKVRPFAFSMDLPQNERCVEGLGDYTVGELRNQANDWAVQIAEPSHDIFIHWDDDDYSHPNRIKEQVTLLQSSGADCVGYNEMLFWREPRSKFVTVNEDGDDVYDHKPGEAWLYSNPDPRYALGTSLCYWRRVWQSRKFEATSQGEDERFIRGLQVQSIGANYAIVGSEEDGLLLAPNGQPRMVARIHSGNSSTAYRIDKMEREAKRGQSPMWRRAPEWNDYCRGVMA